MQAPHVLKVFLHRRVIGLSYTSYNASNKFVAAFDTEYYLSPPRIFVSLLGVHTLEEYINWEASYMNAGSVKIVINEFIPFLPLTFSQGDSQRT